jgi:hypothetical protein
MKCEDCKYWERNKNEAFGECKRFPPIITYGLYPKATEEDIQYNLGNFPNSMEDDWCGEFQPKQTEGEEHR